MTINGGMVMRAWYDVLTLEGVRQEDETGIRESARRVEGLIGAEVARGVAPARVILAGFSQGGAVALHVGFVTPRVSGVSSCYRPTSRSPTRSRRRRAPRAAGPRCSSPTGRRTT